MKMVFPSTPGYQICCRFYLPYLNCPGKPDPDIQVPDGDIPVCTCWCPVNYILTPDTLEASSPNIAENKSSLLPALLIIVPLEPQVPPFSKLIIPDRDIKAFYTDKFQVSKNIPLDLPVSIGKIPFNKMKGNPFLYQKIPSSLT